MTNRWEIQYLKHVESVTGRALSSIARDAGLSPTTLTRPVNNPDHAYTVKLATLEAVERQTGVSFAPFRDRPAGLQEGPVGFQEGSDPSSKMVPVYDVQASAGYGSLVDYEEQTHSLAFPPDYLKKLTSSHPKNLVIISTRGDSMEPTLLDDDIVLVDTSKKHMGFEGMFVLRHNDTLLVKRAGMASRNGYVNLLSDNQAYPAVEAALSDIDVVGKVLWYGRKV